MENNIRNFCIIAHIDHGKSTMADRFLELTGTVSPDKLKPQMLDRMPLERERGITIKLTPVTMNYKLNNQDYILNLIDTPGHVDFSYEVSRSLAAVEGAILLIDASQGIQAQTLANLYFANEQNLKIISVINKIDLPSADIERTKAEVGSLLKIKEDEIILASAKRGDGVKEILARVISDVPAPGGEKSKDLRGLIFDSIFDEYRGVIIFVRLIDGCVKRGDKIKMLSNGKVATVLEVGIFKPDLTPNKELSAGLIGYIATDLKEINDCRVGDTITTIEGKDIKPLPGYRDIKPMVYASLYPKEGNEAGRLRLALERLKLNDASLIFEPEHSPVLGFGFRAGFLGLLHLDVVKERIKREYNLELVITAPSVVYKIKNKNSPDEFFIYSPLELPDPSIIEHIKEPWVKLDIIVPVGYLGAIMELANNFRGNFISLDYLFGHNAIKEESQRAILHYEAPLAMLLVDFYDKLKSASAGYASLSYEFFEFRPAQVVKLDIFVAEEKVESLATIVYEDTVQQVGRRIAETLKEVLPRQMFEVKIQAAVGGKIIASERISAMRKDVTAKLYGGDITRKMKLLDKQKKRKKEMLKSAKVDIPPEAYLAVLRKK
ncbi:MAG: translation elongation factor 4 [Patescibacteria group bacterium]